MSTLSHVPVMEKEVISLFSPSTNTTLLDATVGLGGHAKSYLETSNSSHIIGLDVDANALAQAKDNLAPYQERATLLHLSYAFLDEAVPDADVHHILFDLGVGSHQLQDKSRGISFQSQGPLAMKFAGESTLKLPPSQIQSVAWLEQKLGDLPDASDIITGVSEQELAGIIRTFGEERFAGRIASALKRMAPEADAKTVAATIADAVPGNYERGRIHPATRTFQALRMVVNRELESLRMALPKAAKRLESGGRLLVISFHSLEDRIVKQFLKESQHLTAVHKKPLTATEEEIRQNPRSRSAKLRVAQKN